MTLKVVSTDDPIWRNNVFMFTFGMVLAFAGIIVYIAYIEEEVLKLKMSHLRRDIDKRFRVYEGVREKDVEIAD